MTARRNLRQRRRRSSRAAACPRNSSGRSAPPGRPIPGCSWWLSTASSTCSRRRRCLPLWHLRHGARCGRWRRRPVALAGLPSSHQVGASFRQLCRTRRDPLDHAGRRCGTGGGALTPTTAEGEAVPSTAVHAPRDRSTRIPEVDALRGFALMGILLVNALMTAGPYGLGAITTDPGASALDRTVEGVVQAFAVGKFYLMFTFLGDAAHVGCRNSRSGCRTRGRCARTDRRLPWRRLVRRAGQHRPSARPIPRRAADVFVPASSTPSPVWRTGRSSATAARRATASTTPSRPSPPCTTSPWHGETAGQAPLRPAQDQAFCNTL